VKKPRLEVENIYELNRWLGDKKDSSRYISEGIWEKFKTFVEKELEKTFSDKELSKHLIDEIEKDRKKEARYRGEPERRIIRFHKSLMDLGNSKNTAKNNVGIIMGFYRSNGFKITYTKRFSDLFPEGGKPENRKQLLKPENVQKLLEHAKSLRDKAMILTMYEGGMDLSTLRSMEVKDVREVELKDTEFLTVDLYRQKEEWDYFTHLGPNAVKAIRRYLKERLHNLRKKNPKAQLKGKDPLFVKEWTPTGKPKKVTARLLEKMVRDVAVRSGLLKLAVLEKGQFAPIRPYSLRGSFSTLLEVAPQQYREFWLGHKVKYGGAYFTPSKELSLGIYMQHYEVLSVTETGESRDELNERIRGQQIQIQALTVRLREHQEALDKVPEMIDRALSNVLNSVDWDQKVKKFEELMVKVKAR